MPRFSQLVETLRGRVVAALHSGHLHPGDRLPSVRQLARELGEDPRGILRAYGVLQEEGLVEIRRRSGVYLAPQQQVAPRIRWETSRWVAGGVLVEAWRRRIAIPELPDFIRRCTATAVVRCACVESIEDHRVALCEEIARDFGMDTRPVPLGESGPRDSPEKLRRTLRGMHVIVTTTFHVAEVRRAAEKLEAPVITMVMNPFAREEVARHLRQGVATFVVVDPRFQERLRLVFGSGFRVVLADDRDALRDLDPSETVLLSRAAALRLGRRHLPRHVELKAPLISPETANELAHWLVQLNLVALQAQES